MAVNDLITFRKGIASQWTSVNPVLASGEPGYDLTNGVLKIGDGVSNWVALSGIGSSSVGGSSSSYVGVRGIISTTGNLSSFSVSGGYPVGYLDLFQDGVKLVSTLDFSATDGSNVTLSNSVPSGTVLEYLTMASGVSSGGGSSSLPSNISGSLSVNGDSSYGSVVLLCHGSTVSDSSSYNRTVTLNGAGVSVTGLPKYGSSSFAFTGSTSYVSVPSSSDFSFGTGDFTMESWIYPTAYPENNDGAYISTIFGRQQSGDHCYRMDLLGTASSFTGLFFNGFAANDGGQTVTVNYAFQINTWYHIAVSRVSGILYMFINGVLQNSGGTSFTINIKESSNEARLGALNFGHPYYFQFFGYIADARITKGVGRYSSSFTSPTSEFSNNTPYSLSSVSLSVSGSSGSSSGLSWSSVPASSTASGTTGSIAYDDSYLYIATATNTWKRSTLSSWTVDPYISSVSLLLPMEGTGGSFVDSSSSPKTITTYYGATQSTSVYKFGAKSMYLNGTTFGSAPYISAPYSSAFDLSAGDWTVECWAYATALNESNNLFAITNTGSSYAQATVVPLANGSAYFLTQGAGGDWLDTTLAAAGTFVLNTWQHVAAVRSGNVFRLYVNGTSVISFNSASALSSGSGLSTIGARLPAGNSSVGSQTWQGYIDDFRVTKGLARYSGASLTVPTEAFPVS